MYCTLSTSSKQLCNDITYVPHGPCLVKQLPEAHISVGLVWHVSRGYTCHIGIYHIFILTTLHRVNLTTAAFSENIDCYDILEFHNNVPFQQDIY